MSDLQKRAHVSKLLVQMAEYYGRTLTPNQTNMYAEDLMRLSIQQISEALKAYREDPKNRTFPLPAQLIQIVDPQSQLTAEDYAKDAASRIVAAVSEIGPYNSAAAQTYIGELGWLVVEREGGWANICRELSYENMGTLKAQWRELAISLYRRASAGEINQAPKLPSPNKRGGELRSLSLENE